MSTIPVGKRSHYTCRPSALRVPEQPDDDTPLLPPRQRELIDSDPRFFWSERRHGSGRRRGSIVARAFAVGDEHLAEAGSMPALSLDGRPCGRASTYSLAIRRVSRTAVVIVPVTGSELSVWKARIEALRAGLTMPSTGPL